MPILLIASADVCDEAFATIAHHLRSPVITRDCGSAAQSEWPQGDHTLVLRHPDRLSVEEQYALLRWMDEEGQRAHVVSIACPQLYARVEAGLFLDRLYYRLNAMTFVLTRQA